MYAPVHERGTAHIGFQIARFLFYYSLLVGALFLARDPLYQGGRALYFRFHRYKKITWEPEVDLNASVMSEIQLEEF